MFEFARRVPEMLQPNKGKSWERQCRFVPLRLGIAFFLRSLRKNRFLTLKADRIRGSAHNVGDTEHTRARRVSTRGKRKRRLPPSPRQAPIGKSCTRYLCIKINTPQAKDAKADFDLKRVVFFDTRKGPDIVRAFLVLSYQLKQGYLSVFILFPGSRNNVPHLVKHSQLIAFLNETVP